MTNNNNNANNNNNNNKSRGRSFSTHSQRGKRAVSLLPDYLSDARAVTKYCPTTAPNGALQLGVAENQMLEDMLVPALTEFQQSGTFAADCIYYQPTHGRPALRQAFCGYLERLLALPDNATLDPEGLVMGTGCNAVLENLCIALAETGEGVLIPTPYYAAFEFDLVARAGLSIIPVNTFQHSGATIPPIVVDVHANVDANATVDATVDTDTDTDDSDDDASTTTTTTTTTTSTTSTIPIEAYYPTKAGLTAALQAAREEGESPRILLLSHPNNPLGISYPPQVIQDCIDWCRQHKIHLISDEIYAGSVYQPKDANFVSALALAKSKGEKSLGDYIHFVYSLSKDFALSGLRVGAVYSENQHIRLPLQKLNDLCQISSQTQVLVEKMCTAKVVVPTATTTATTTTTTTTQEETATVFWTDDFLATNQSRIQARCHALQAVLNEFDIPHLKPTSGLFCWMDMSQFLPPLVVTGNDNNNDCLDANGNELLFSMQKRERVLYLQLMNDFGLLFTPGLSMSNERPGFFRCVFTAASDDEFALALARIRTFSQFHNE